MPPRKPNPAPLVRQVPVYEFKSRLSEYLRTVEKGSELTVTAHGQPLARVVPLTGVPVRKAELDARRIPLPPPPRRKVTSEQLRRALEDERDDAF